MCLITKLLVVLVALTLVSTDVLARQEKMLRGKDPCFLFECPNKGEVCQSQTRDAVCVPFVDICGLALCKDGKQCIVSRDNTAKCVTIRPGNKPKDTVSPATETPEVSDPCKDFPCYLGTECTVEVDGLTPVCVVFDDACAVVRCVEGTQCIINEDNEAECQENIDF